MQTFLFYKDNSLVYDLSFVKFFSTGEVERDKKLRKESSNNTNYYYYCCCSIITKGVHSSYLLYHFNYGIQQVNEFY